MVFLKRLLSFFLSLLIPLLSLAGCGHTVEPDEPGDFITIPEQGGDLFDPGAEVDPEGQLLAIVETEEEAQALAELYGITLARYNSPVAVFFTEENPTGVIARGQANGWPELSLNDIQTIF